MAVECLILHKNAGGGLTVPRCVAGGFWDILLLPYTLSLYWSHQSVSCHNVVLNIPYIYTAYNSSNPDYTFWFLVNKILSSNSVWIMKHTATEVATLSMCWFMSNSCVKQTINAAHTAVTLKQQPLCTHTEQSASIVKYRFHSS